MYCVSLPTSLYYKDLEIARLAEYWQEAIDILGKDDPFVVRVLGNKTPLAAATEVIEGTRIDRADERRNSSTAGKPRRRPRPTR